MNFLLLVLLSSQAFSMTISEITTIATDRSSSLSAQEMEAHALQSESFLRGRWQNPQIMGQFGTLKSGTMRGSTVEVSVSQPIPLSDKFSLRREIANLALENHNRQTNFFKQWVAHQSLLAAWRVHVSSELLKHGKERAKRLSLVKTYMETRPKVTIKQRVELSIINSTLIQMERMHDLKNHEYEIAKSDLEFWLGKKLTEEDIPFDVPKDYKFFEDLKLDTTKDIELAQAKNVAKLSKLDVELASKERRPDLFLGGGYRVENVAPVNHFSYAIVGLNIPLWDTGSSRVDAAKVREKRDQKNLEETEKRLTLKHQKQIEVVRYNIEQLRRFPKKIIDQNEKSIKEAEVGFRQGLLDVNTFILAETQSHEVIDQVFVSWFSYLESLSSLQLMNGEKLNWENN